MFDADNYKGELLASASMDQTVKLWRVYEPNETRFCELTGGIDACIATIPHSGLL